MKINFENLKTGVKISTLRVGDTFVAHRKSCEDIAVYLIVDANSGLFNAFNIGSQNVVALNLGSGQFRKFNKDAMVDRAEAEVTFKKQF